MARARELSTRYLDGRAEPASVRWVGNQNTRWGSCTPVDATIRLSTRLRGMPTYVVDYVLLHELAHLLVPGHGPRFWTLLAAYPRTERARGYLEGVAAASGLTMSDDDPGDTGPDAASDEPEPPRRPAARRRGRCARGPQGHRRSGRCPFRDNARSRGPQASRLIRDRPRRFVAAPDSGV